MTHLTAQSSKQIPSLFFFCETKPDERNVFFFFVIYQTNHFLYYDLRLHLNLIKPTFILKLTEKFTNNFHYLIIFCFVANTVA